MTALLMFGFSAGLLAYYLLQRRLDPSRKAQKGYIEWMQETLDKMFIKVSRKRCTAIILSSSFFAGAIGFYFSFNLPAFANILITLGSLALGFVLPRLVISFKLKKRLEKFDTQLIDALTLMSNSIRSGLNLNQAINVVVNELSNPCSQEFGLVLSQHNMGLTLDEALERMMIRLGTEDIIMVINSILILREKGGDITETFNVIANTVRGRKKVETKIKTITAQGKMQSFLLLAMPFAVGIVMYIMNPENVLLLFTTSTGWTILGIMAVMQTIGGLWLKKIVDIKV
jgi:tight adherence protein B